MNALHKERAEYQITSPETMAACSTTLSQQHACGLHLISSLQAEPAHTSRTNRNAVSDVRGLKRITGPVTSDRLIQQQGAAFTGSCT
jgi:hypothetical protein